MASIETALFSWLQEWSGVISGLGSLALTAGLVHLYRRQTSIQEDQQDLLRQELNREVRQGHTETLKRRIRAWHGDMDEVGSSEGDPWSSDETNLPKVLGADVKPAPAFIDYATAEPEFRVVPEILEGDRYLNDLLVNHAPELQRLKVEIEQFYSDFNSAKETFCEEYPSQPTVEADDYILQPRSEFAEWIFERAVLLNREHRGNEIRRMEEIAETRLTGTNPSNVEKGIQFYSPTGIEGEGPSTYEAIATSGDFDDLGPNEEEIESKVIAFHLSAIEGIETGELFDLAEEAADILDEMTESVKELRSKLVEHAGHPIYLEDCQYTEDVTL